MRAKSPQGCHRLHHSGGPGMAKAGYETTYQEAAPALLVGPAAAILALFVWDDAMWALVYGKFEVLTDFRDAWIWAVLYIPVLIITVIFGGPVWLLLHKLRLRPPLVFMGVGATLAMACLYFAAPHRFRYVRPPFMVAPVIAGACGGWVLHRIAYQRRRRSDTQPAAISGG